MNRSLSSREEEKNSRQRRERCAEAQECGESLVCTGNHKDLPVGCTRGSKCPGLEMRSRAARLHRDLKDGDRRVNLWVIGV